MKKKMYYNMRIKTLQRNFSSLNKLIKTAKEIKIDDLEKQIWNIESDSFIKSEDRISEKYNEIFIQEKNYEIFKNKLRETSKLTINRLICELETGGNIRLEEGKGLEKWYISCNDLIKSRFHPEEMSTYEITDINVQRVIRIHNRFLRTKFEEMMESQVDISNPNYKKSLEYLFYGHNIKFPNEILHIIEEGFRPPDEALSMGLCPYPQLVNSILGADAPRLAGIKLKKDGKTIEKSSLLICKVLILKSEVDLKNPNFEIEKERNQIFFENKFDLSNVILILPLISIN